MNENAFNLIKMFPLQANVEDIEWLCDEVDRLKHENDKLRDNVERTGKLLHTAMRGLIVILPDKNSKEKS